MKRKFMQAAIVALVGAPLCFFSACTQQASIALPALFSDNMVLQQQSDVPLWGTATPEAAVSVRPSWTTDVYDAQANAEGAWRVELPTPAASLASHTIIITCDAASDTLHNVLVGEVWLCSGQSNMEMPLAGWGKVQNYEAEIAAADYPNIRLLQVEKQCAVQPQRDVKVWSGAWQPCSPQTVGEFSSVAYFFGRELQQRLNVPIGLINASWGGTVAEAWMSAGALKAMPDFADAVAKVETTREADYDKAMAEWTSKVAQADSGMSDGSPVWASLTCDDSAWKTMALPAQWETERGMETFNGIAWFRLALDLPAAFAGKDLTLHLAEIDDNDITYFNGEKVGATDGYATPRTYVVPARLVRAGRNVIAVRVTDTGGGGGLWGEAKRFFAEQGGEQISLARRWKYRVSADLAQLPPRPASLNDPNRPTVLYNAMIAPLVPFTIRGAIWYQGEANASRAAQYATLFPRLIGDWRRQWDCTFPFYFVQLASYDAPDSEDWPALRAAQLGALELTNTGMAVTIDIGNEHDIHPKNKQEVGRRLALWAEAETYGLSVPSYCGPMYAFKKVAGGKLLVAFTHANEGLKTNDGKPLGGFELAGEDRVYHAAEGRIVSKGAASAVELWSEKVPKPAYVRYAWSDVCKGANLSNGAGLPASPFSK